MKTKLVAVTGGIGSGQSSVSKLLESEHGAKVIHADLISRQIVDTNREVQKLLKKEFGKEFFDRNGKLKRKELAATVFIDKNKIQRLNKIVHPILVQELIREVEEAQESKKYKIVIIDAALIYEIAIERYFDFVVVVYAPKQQRIKRVMQRDGLSKNLILDRMEQQFDLNEKKAWADFVVDNSKDFDHLKQNVAKLYQQLIKARL